MSIVISVVKLLGGVLFGVDAAVADLHDEDLARVTRLSLTVLSPADSARLTDTLDGMDRCLLILRCAAGLCMAVCKLHRDCCLPTPL